ncbi:Hypothetical protein CINCED_3A003246 [Cinara cedri]|uniref:Uncharacterized protein n=1 Tax=Cinara cedri TaxID=506608 RepID=A0A5E4LYX6_9HEMI|nr:Hypothetical protein CINCED_3A003246 [Cinara cedri]
MLYENWVNKGSCSAARRRREIRRQRGNFDDDGSERPSRVVMCLPGSACVSVRLLLRSENLAFDGDGYAEYAGVSEGQDGRNGTRNQILQEARKTGTCSPGRAKHVWTTNKTATRLNQDLVNPFGPILLNFYKGSINKRSVKLRKLIFKLIGKALTIHSTAQVSKTQYVSDLDRTERIGTSSFSDG